MVYRNSSQSFIASVGGVVVILLMGAVIYLFTRPPVCHGKQSVEPFTVEGRHIIDLENDMLRGKSSYETSSDQHRSSPIVGQLVGFSSDTFSSTR